MNESMNVKKEKKPYTTLRSSHIAQCIHVLFANATAAGQRMWVANDIYYVKRNRQETKKKKNNIDKCE